MAIDVKRYRERIAERHAALGGATYLDARPGNDTPHVSCLKVPVTDLEELLQAYERTTGDRCRDCGVELTAKRPICHCENDE